MTRRELAVERADSDQPKVDKIAATEARERAAPADDVPAEIKVPAGQSQVNIQLPADKAALSEVVVTGYDNSKKEKGTSLWSPFNWLNRWVAKGPTTNTWMTTSIIPLPHLIKKLKAR